jgi:hypothetical protein
LKGPPARPQVQLPPDEGLALVAYTHNVNNVDGSKEGNVYFECNRMLRLRSVEQRAAMMRTWGAYVHYLLRGLGRLPNVIGDVFRGYPRARLCEYSQVSPRCLSSGAPEPPPWCA